MSNHQTSIIIIAEVIARTTRFKITLINKFLKALQKYCIVVPPKIKPEQKIEPEKKIEPEPKIPEKKTPEPKTVKPVARNKYQIRTDLDLNEKLLNAQREIKQRCGNSQKIIKYADVEIA